MLKARCSMVIPNSSNVSESLGTLKSSFGAGAKSMGESDKIVYVDATVALFDLADARGQDGAAEVRETVRQILKA